MSLKKVLIVDDSATMRKIIARVLRQADIAIDEVFEASNGLEGLECIASDPEIELVLSDLNMPVMDGLAFLRAVRETHDKKSLPMIMVSTEGGKLMKQAALESGANAYVTKPFNPDTVRMALEEYLG